ncbi:MAG TPA: histidine phosphatase family protein [Candidatus Limnocylindria bacterium]|nr:histidine phosphatase family protein [Candidatus Limnocylindria bacterium]
MPLGRLDVLLVRHAEAVPAGTAGWEERDHDRPLSAAGRRAAEELADELEPYVLTGVYSSPYRRAVETVEPTAQRRGLRVIMLDDLRERLLTTAPRDDWRDHLTASWADPDYALEGTETGRQAQRRGSAVLDLLRVRHPDGGRLLLGSHGNLISLILQALEPGVNVDFHLAMPMPAIYHLEHDGRGWRVMGGHGFVRVAPRN